MTARNVAVGEPVEAPSQSTAGRLARTVTVCDRDPRLEETDPVPGHTWFTWRDEDTDEVNVALALPLTTWREFGSPGITVSVDPGDHLNT